MTTSCPQSEKMFSIHKFLYGNDESYAVLISSTKGQTCHIVKCKDNDAVLRLYENIVRAIDSGYFPKFSGCTFSEISTIANAKRIELAITAYDKALDANSVIDILSELPIGRIS